MAEKNLKNIESPLEKSEKAARPEGVYLAPPVDVYETDEGLTLLADVPGLDEKSLYISVDKGILTLEGSAAVPGADQLYREFSMAGYWRQFQIPDMFDAAKAEADMKGGVLTLHIPKTETAKPKRIEVTAH